MRNETRRRKRLEQLDVPTLERLLAAAAASNPRWSAPLSVPEATITEAVADHRAYTALIADEIRRRG